MTVGSPLVSPAIAGCLTPADRRKRIGEPLVSLVRRRRRPTLLQQQIVIVQFNNGPHGGFHQLGIGNEGFAIAVRYLLLAFVRVVTLWLFEQAEGRRPRFLVHRLIPFEYRY
jgi:hypothetical protein